MAKNKSKNNDGMQTQVDWSPLIGRWSSMQLGFHLLEAPFLTMMPDLPNALQEMYAEFGGGRLYMGELDILPPPQVRKLSAEESGAAGELYAFAHLGDDPVEEICCDAHGRVYRFDDNIDEWILEGTTLLRFMLAMHEALMVYFEDKDSDREGNQDDDDEEEEEAFGEGNAPADDLEDAQLQALLDAKQRAKAISSCRAQHKRDAKAPGPLWRMARLLVESDSLDFARDALEQVATLLPSQAWVWHDLGRISELVGDEEGAIDELSQAAEVATSDPVCGYFHANIARLEPMQVRDILCEQVLRAFHIGKLQA